MSLEHTHMSTKREVLKVKYTTIYLLNVTHTHTHTSTVENVSKNIENSGTVKWLAGIGWS